MGAKSGSYLATALLIVIGFLVLYPLFMLFFGSFKGGATRHHQPFYLPGVYYRLYQSHDLFHAVGDLLAGGSAGGASYRDSYLFCLGDNPDGYAVVGFSGGPHLGEVFPPRRTGYPLPETLKKLGLEEII